MTEERLKAQIEAIHASTSWKITAPLRYCAQALKISYWREVNFQTGVKKSSPGGCVKSQKL